MANQRPGPRRLAGKLLHIRAQLGLTQELLRQRLEYGKGPKYAAHISRFETGERVPDLLVLLRYARLAGVPMDALVDDDLDLPDKLPGRWRFTPSATAVKRAGAKQ